MWILGFLLLKLRDKKENEAPKPRKVKITRFAFVEVLPRGALQSR